MCNKDTIITFSHMFPVPFTFPWFMRNVATETGRDDVRVILQPEKDPNDVFTFRTFRDPPGRECVLFLHEDFIWKLVSCCGSVQVTSTGARVLYPQVGCCWPLAPLSLSGSRAGSPSPARFHPAPRAWSPCRHLVPSPSHGAWPAGRWCSGLRVVLEAAARLPQRQAAPAAVPACRLNAWPRAPVGLCPARLCQRSASSSNPPLGRPAPLLARSSHLISAVI